MKHLSKILVSLMVLVGVSSAHGMFLIEPNVGFAVSGDWELSTQSDDVSQTTYGAKLGYEFPMGFHIGADVQMGSGSYSKLGNIFTQDMDGSGLSYGVAVGYQSMLGVRAYLSYFLSSEIDFDDTASTTFKGNGIKVGLGYRVMAYLALNLEYHAMAYDEYEDSTDSGSLGSDFKSNLIVLNASFPLSF